MPRALRYLVCIGLLLSGGCASLAPLLSTPTPVPVSKATPTPEVSVTQTKFPETKARIVRVWLPPQFNPNTSETTAMLLKQRLDEFEAGHPGLEIEVRIKAQEGDAGLLNSLTVTNMAAPSALPDLVALPRSILEAAALKGLLHPIDGLSTILDDPNWYGYARQLGHIQNAGYGIPFAGDALVLIRRPDEEAIGDNWNDIFAGGGRLIFPVGDPQGLVGLSLYISAGGVILDSKGLPALDEGALTRLLIWVSDGISADVISPSLVNITTDTQALDVYLAGNANMLITWALQKPPNSLIFPLPGLSDSNHSIATGWVWALAGSDPENQQLAVELGEYLVADDFADRWTREIGYLPTRPSSMEQDDAGISAILESAQSIPTNDVLAVLGPLMQEALTRVLNGEQPEAVARSVIEKLK